MGSKEHAKQWYSILKAMKDVIDSRQQYAFFLTTNYRSVKEGKYNWKKGFEPDDEKAILRLMNADMMSNVIKNIESFLQIASVGLKAQEEGINHQEMIKNYFSTDSRLIPNTIKKLTKNTSLETRKWVLWITDLDETKAQMKLSHRETNAVSKLYDSMLERIRFVFSSASEFWKLYKPVRNAFSHTFRFISCNHSNFKLSQNYEDIILVLDKNKKNNSIVQMTVLSGQLPMHAMAEAIAAFNLVEKIILENHLRSIKLNSQRIFSNHMIADISKQTFELCLGILQRTPKEKEIENDFTFEFNQDEIEKQIKIYDNFRMILSKLGRKIPYDDVREPLQPTMKGTRKLKQEKSG